MNDLHRAFFHELGHFVAQELNWKYFNGTGTESIDLYPCDGYSNIYCGEIEPTKPPNYSEDQYRVVPLEKLAQFLAMNVYGCIFQSYFLRDSLGSCFAPQENGGKDYAASRGQIDLNRLLSAFSQFYQVCEDHFAMLRQSHIIDVFIKLSPEDFLESRGGGNYSVNLEKLRKSISLDISNHLPHYEKFTTELQSIIIEKKGVIKTVTPL